MLIQPMQERLRQMRLVGMGEAFAQQLDRPDVVNLSFEERPGLLVDHKWTYRQDQRMARLLREATLRLLASLEAINYRYPRGLDRSVIRSLPNCYWERPHQAFESQDPRAAARGTAPTPSSSKG